jgi:glycosyltransferase involved in cell wall biosynthesis
MNIGIELRHLTLGASGGVSQLVKGVCEYLFYLHPEQTFFVFCTPFNRNLLRYEGGHVHYLTLPIDNFFQEMDKLIVKNEIQVIFRSYPSEDDLSFPIKRQIFLVPDIQHEHFPSFFSKKVLESRRRAFARALGEAGAIGTISEFARDTLTDFLDTKCKDIFLMPPSLQESHKKSDQKVGFGFSESTLIPQGDFFIFPANIWPHKNHLRLLEAFQLFMTKAQHNVRLVLTGHPDGWDQISYPFSSLPITHLGFVEPELLRMLLERSKALVFFSLYEGFGMPLLEAFDAGTPVICSNTTSLPEVGGDAVLSCDPTDIEAIATLMERILSDHQLRRILIEKGKARLKLFSWEESAESLLSSFQRVVANTLDKSCQEITVQNSSNLVVSIVTPSYNQGRFLKRTIESVLKQDYPFIEYLVVDGASKDDSVEILESYGDKFKWLSESDKGQTNAINKGLAKTRGEILGYLNSDDILLPHSIEKVVSFFNSHPDCVLLYGEAFYIDENDEVIGEYKTAEYSFERLLEDCMVCQPAAFWRREVTEELGLFDETLDFAMDYDYWLRIAKITTYDKRIYHLPSKLACSRLYPETKTLSKRSSVYKEIFQVCKKNIGYVHESYYHGYWHYLIYENDNFWSLFLRLFPFSTYLLPRCHYRLFRSRVVYSKISKKSKEKLKNFLKRIRYIIKRKMAFSRVKHIKVVSGYWPDNWLEQRVMIMPNSWPIDKDLFIGGISPLDMTITIRIGGREFYRGELLAEQYSKIQFSCKMPEAKLIEIYFSKAFVDSSKRRLSFLLQETNIFSEQDIH